MMRILIVEDENDKLEQLILVLRQKFGSGVEIKYFESLFSSIRNISKSDVFDLAVLDMSMPNYDISPEEPTGGQPESFAGRELMYQMKLRNKLCPMVVVTQYRSFDKGLIDILDLDAEFKKEFNNYYLGYVYYNSAIDGWKDTFTNILDKNFKGNI
ncbi:response regulator [Serratia proteamaculans]|uniref:response regulator n=1 Tax=Serratia proteamaculans TaxID=28151 RepID=UPI0021BDEC49|nr:response regulator [Serratia proteamaculans]